MIVFVDNILDTLTSLQKKAQKSYLNI